MVKGRRSGIWLLLLLSLMLAACAQTEVKRRYDPYGGKVQETWPVWPGSPEVPRYIYAGQLTGEANFPAVQEDQGSDVERAIAWLVGLSSAAPEPRVLQRPQSGTVDSRGRVLVTDVSRQGLYVFDVEAGELAVWTRATAERDFVSPIGVAESTEGRILVTDSELGIVAVLNDEGRPLPPFGKGLLRRPTGIAVDRTSGRIFVADTRANDIKIFDSQGDLIDTLGAEGDMPGYLNAPTYIDYREGALYISDTLNSRIQIVRPEDDSIQQVGERGLYVGNLTRPKGVAVDSEGKIFIVESYYDHLLIFNGTGEFLMPIGGSGNRPGQFFLPAGVWVDGRDQVYVADMFNGRVVVFQYLGGSS